ELVREGLTVLIALDGRVEGVHGNALLSAAEINHPVRDDTEQPAFKRAVGIVGVEIVPRADIGVLCHIFCVCSVPRQAVRQIVGAALAAQKQFLKLLLRGGNSGQRGHGRFPSLSVVVSSRPSRLSRRWMAARIALHPLSFTRKASAPAARAWARSCSYT